MFPMLLDHSNLPSKVGSFRIFIDNLNFLLKFTNIYALWGKEIQE